LFKSHYHGNYSFEANVIIGECAVGKLFEIGDKTISFLARQLQHPAPENTRKV